MRANPVILSFLLAVPVASYAQHVPPEGCFCLADSREPLPQVQRGCRRDKFPSQFFWRGICRYVDAAGQTVVAPAIAITDEWIILLPDHPDCALCEPQGRETDDVPRGDKNTEVAE